MGTKRRPKPIFLSSKLRQIRQYLHATQSEMATRVAERLNAARISEYETGLREPNLMVLLHYARAARVSVDDLIDDEAELVFGTRKKEAPSVLRRL